jgi:hypothetical protein
MPDGAKFCSECGQRLAPVDALPTEETAAPLIDADAGEATVAEAEPETAETADASPAEAATDPAPRAGSPLAAFLVVLALLAGLAAGAFFLLPLWTQDPARATAADLFPNKAGLQWHFTTTEKLPIPNEFYLDSAAFVAAKGGQSTALTASAKPASFFLDNAKPVNVAMSKTGVTVSHLFAGVPGMYMRFDPPLQIVKTPFRAGQSWTWKGKLVSEGAPGLEASAKIANVVGTVPVRGKSAKSIRVKIDLAIRATDPYGLAPPETVNVENGLDVVPHYGIVRYTWALKMKDQAGRGSSANLEPTFSYHPILGYQAPKAAPAQTPKANKPATDKPATPPAPTKK